MIRRMIARLINWLGWPGIVRPCDYMAMGHHVTVRLTRRFTIINHNGMDIYFYRESGGIDGVGGPSELMNVVKPQKEDSDG